MAEARHVFCALRMPSNGLWIKVWEANHYHKNDISHKMIVMTICFPDNTALLGIRNAHKTCLTALPFTFGGTERLPYN